MLFQGVVQHVCRFGAFLEESLLPISSTMDDCLGFHWKVVHLFFLLRYLFLHQHVKFVIYIFYFMHLRLDTLNSSQEP